MSNQKSLTIDTKLFKRIQSQVNRKLPQHQISISLGSVREHVVQNHTDLTEARISLVVDELVDICLGAQEKAMSVYQGQEITIQEGIVDKGSLSAPLIDEQTSELQSSSMVAAQQVVPQQNQLAMPSSVDYSTICSFVQEEFANESKQMQLELVSYLEEQTFSSMLQLRQSLAELRKFRVDVLRKLIADHNDESNKELYQLRSALQLGQSQRQAQAVEETNAFLASLADKKAVFGL